MADLHVPLRAGQRPGVPRRADQLRREQRALAHEPFFREYVPHYTNAPLLVADDFRDTEDLDGLFSGFDAASARYDTDDLGATPSSRRPARRQHAAQDAQPREGGAGHEQPPARRATRRCSTRAACSRSCGATSRATRRRWSSRPAACPPDLFLKVAEAILANSGRERTTAFCYAVAWTQHTTGSQIIGCCAILQLLLGNIGRPGGGILALRGHATIQGSTDIPTLYNLLPGYIPMPTAAEATTSLGDFLEHETAGRRALVQPAELPGQPAEGLVRRRRHGRQRLGLRPGCRRSAATTRFEAMSR